MKKIFIIFVLLLSLAPLNVYAQDKKDVKYKSCIDGDTATFVMNKRKVKVRLLAVDTPETNHPTKGEEPYGKEAKKFTCNKLKNAKKIQLEFDDNSDKKDKYDRYLAWVFYDDHLLQSELVKRGYAEVTYLYGNYKYTSLLKDNEENAKIKKVGIYSDVDNSEYTKNTDTKTKVKKIAKKYAKKLSASIYQFISEILDEIF
ncbi:MAG: thermonuclease family protein [Bacilli bacterium]|nr:thermonuclease family protein [Bacilli bacterium]